MDHAHEERARISRAPDPAPRQKTPELRSSERELLELQRTAGNQAVAHAMTVQRHSLDPEQMEEGS